MEITRSEFSVEQDEVEEWSEEIEQLEKASNQLSDQTVFEKTEENPVTTSKEAPERSAEQKKNAEASLAATSGTAPDEAPAHLAAPGEKRPENPARSSAAPRKNVIPPRPTASENGRRTSSGALKNSSWPAESASLNGQTGENSSSESGEAQENQASARSAADLPTSVLPSVSAQNTRTNSQPERQGQLADEPTHELPAQKAQSSSVESATQTRERQQRDGEVDQQTAVMETPRPDSALPTEQARLIELPTTPLPSVPPVKSASGQTGWLTRGRAIFLALLLAILIINATVTGFGRFFGPQGWGSAFAAPNNAGQNLISQLQQQLRHTPTPGGTAQPTTTPLTPTQIVNALMANMTLDQKLGQMMMIQFFGSDYSAALSTMINQYQVGAVLFFTVDGNVVSKPQVKSLISQMQHDANIPLIVSIDQEGGAVDRLVNLDGPQPSESTISANGTNAAYQQGIKDSQDLSDLGFNLNLAPVVDVSNANVYNEERYDGRTYGDTPVIVTQMAGAYLRGLQQSGKVMGTLKHFPGLGDVSADPHHLAPDLTRSLSNLNAVDWAPYSNLINQGVVHTIMVTHEYVTALDNTYPASLSPKVIGVLRKQMNFNGVIMTDDLNMAPILNYYTFGQAAVQAIIAGNDLVLGADSPSTLAQMLTAIHQAVTSGAISEQQIDNSVRRILLLKYEMGLIQV